MLIVIAVGGNALLQPGEPLLVECLIRNSQQATKLLAEIAKQHEIVVVHGNGPQIGILALQAQAYSAIPAYPFDILNAETQGMIGYLLQQGLVNALAEKSVVTLITQAVIDNNDPHLYEPSKPIGPFYDDNILQQIKCTYPRWQIQRYQQGWRRIVASPCPIDIIELPIIKTLVHQKTIVIAGGGGGIPCVQGENHQYQGIEAVIDKDLTASLIAQRLQADRFIVLTNVDAVYQQWRTKQRYAIETITPEKLTALPFEAGTMQPKIMAACEFVNATKQVASIGALSQLTQVLQCQSGTHVVPD
ncbi:MAG: carbamate kinase [Gammaproteobacteria bacterium]